MPTTPGHVLSPTSFAYGLTVEAELASVCHMLTGAVDDDGRGDRPYAFGVETRTGTKRGSTSQVAMQPIMDDEDAHGAFDIRAGEESEGTTLYDQVRHDFYSLSGKIENRAWEQQQVQFSLENRELRSIGGRWGQRWDKWVLNQMAGSLSEELRGSSKGAYKEYVGGNNVHDPVAASDTGHIIYATGSTEAAVAADSTAIFTLDLVKEFRSRASTQNVYGNKYAGAPCYTPWGEYYVIICHTEQWNQLLTYSTTNEFVMLSQATLQGGSALERSVFGRMNGAIFHDTLILASQFIPKGLNGTAARDNCRRAVGLCADSGRWLFGEDFSYESKLRLVTDEEYLRKGYQGYTISGFKALVATETNQRWGSFVISTYSAV